MAATRSASVIWDGDLAHGQGHVTADTSGAFRDLPVSWAARTGSADGRTSPEEFLASAHASCFAMALSNVLAKGGTPSRRLQVQATVTFEQAEGGYRVASSALSVRGTVPGIDAAGFQRAAEDAKENCPISRALRGNVTLSVQGTLEGAE